MRVQGGNSSVHLSNVKVLGTWLVIVSSDAVLMWTTLLTFCQVLIYRFAKPKDKPAVPRKWRSVTRYLHTAAWSLVCRLSALSSSDSSSRTLPFSKVRQCIEDASGHVFKLTKRACLITKTADTLLWLSAAQLPQRSELVCN